MNVLHINTSQQGGAALCAFRINVSLVEQGIDSRMLFASGNEIPLDVKGEVAFQDRHFWQSPKWLFNLVTSFLRHIPFLMNVWKLSRIVYNGNNKKLYTHIPLTQYRNLPQHPLVQWADIIHLHWVAEFIDYPTFFRKIKKPIVWTLHDKYPAVGLMHFSSEFFPIPVELKRIDDYCRMIKRKSVIKAYDLNLVAISERMVDICSNSNVLKGFPVTLIHNGVDTNVFHPYNKTKARVELHLPLDTTLFLFSACDVSDKNKGLDRIIKAIEKCDVPNKTLVCVGYSNDVVIESSFTIIFSGMINNHDILAKYYSAADYLLQGSYEETFSQTPLEAMSCGTPVISTPCSGATDVIRSFNGVKCNGYDADSIADGIKEVLNKQYDAEIIRQYIVDNYRYEKIAQQYISLYESILGKCQEIS